MRNFNRRCTQVHADEGGASRLSEPIIGCAFQVLNTLGAGFLENVYENALARELRKAGTTVAQQQGVTVANDVIVVGEYNVDLEIQRIAQGLCRRSGYLRASAVEIACLL